MAEKKVFPTGIYAKAPHEKVRGWTAANISIKVADAIPWLKEHENVAGYVNLLVKYNEKGMYVEKDTWVPNKDKATEQESNQTELNNMPSTMTSVQPDGSEEIDVSEIPF